ncbi:hypothetical protein M404DRAFT_31476 [Pisolithus tinctorius Marx 270]|uniref:Uncharacterized protein n=1 Tax=Pisolithus tinctorius Marx 270 TaxID=870435 RepID=A0A0C3IN02_PISTI|nr:hypothetical protein M404DRAFT_31476 [Pisolithus tinctorius Marx 270]
MTFAFDTPASTTPPTALTISTSPPSLSLLDMIHALNTHHHEDTQSMDPNFIPPSTPSSFLLHASARSSLSSAVTSISHRKRKAKSIVMSESGLKHSQPPSAKVHAEEDCNSSIAAITSKLDNFMHVITAPLPLTPLPPITNPLVNATMDYINNMLQLSTDNQIDISDYFLSVTLDEVNIFLKHQELVKWIWVQHQLMKY